MSNIKIVPYCEVNGIRTFQDTEICNLYFKMLTHSENIFVDGSVRNADDFLYMFKYDRNELYVIYYQNKIAAFCFLNHFDGRSAQIHFCIFKQYWGKVGRDFGRELLTKLLNTKDQDGSYTLDVILGLVPFKNKHAYGYAQRVGGKFVGLIPSAIWNEEKQHSENASLFYFIREFIT